MIAIIVDNCTSCPFAIADEPPWLCDAQGFEAEIGPRALPERSGYSEPPEWCPLREADRLVTLRVAANP